MVLGLAASATAAEALSAHTFTSSRDGSERLLVDNPRHPTPAPVGTDRLPLAWYQGQSRRLREQARARGVDVVLLQSDVNLVYFTGCFRGSGERTTWAMMPTRETDTVYWFSPAIAQETAITPLQPGQRVYVYVGGSEGDDMLSDAEAMAVRWKATLPATSALQFAAAAKAGHNEAAWRTALPDALCWTFAPACEAAKPAR